MSHEYEVVRDEGRVEEEVDKYRGYGARSRRTRDSGGGEKSKKQGI